MLDRIRNDLPNQFINAGISEQNAVSLSAGMANDKKKVILYSINSFLVFRALEQLKLDISYNSNPITIVTVGPGFAYGVAGPTHHSIEDVSILNSISGINLYSPSDSNTVKFLSHKVVNSKSTNYMRLERGHLKKFPFTKKDYDNGYRSIKQGKDIIFIGYGINIERIFQIEKHMKKKIQRNINFEILDLFRLKPLNIKLLCKKIRKFKYAFILEEQIETGGISSYLAKILLEQKINIIYKSFTVPDGKTYNFGDRNYIYKKVNLDNNEISKSIIKIIK
jgi:transketolase